MDRLIELQPQLIEAFFITLYLVSVSLAASAVIGLVIGTALYVTRAGGIWPNRAINVILNVVVNTFRPIPFILIAVAMAPVIRSIIGTGSGNSAAIFAMVFGAAFAVGRIVEQNLVALDPGVLEAARAMGASRRRVIFTVLIPESLGPLILGFTFVFVAIVDMSAIVGVVGAGGLGNFALTYGFRQFNPWVTWATILIVIILVQVGQFTGNALARKVLRR